MSTIGKGALSLRKQDVSNQKTLGIGVTKVVFAHKATGGESTISLASLSAPSELLSQGFVQPSSGTLSDLNIYFYRRNLSLESSLRGKLIDFLSYSVSNNSTITLNGFTLLAGEIIVGTIDPVTKNELLVVDGEAIASTGALAIGVTDFSVGTPFEIYKYPTQQIGAVKVYRKGLLQARCDGNSLLNEGNYIEVPVTGGFGTLIRFKNAPASEAEGIIVTSNGAYFERPIASQMATIENLAGQLDKVVNVLSDVSGQPTTYFRSAPNSVDLLTFGNTVIAYGEKYVPILGEVKNETITGTHTNATYDCKSHQIGEFKYYDVGITYTGAPAAGQLFVNLPTGDLVDAAKLVLTSRVKLEGSGTLIDTGNNLYPVHAEYNGASSIAIASAVVSGANVSHNNGITNTVPFTIGAGDFLNIKFKLPIVGLVASKKLKDL